MDKDTIFTTQTSTTETHGGEEMEAMMFAGWEGTALVSVIFFMAVIIAFGSIGNLLVILAVVQTKKLQTVANLFVANLSICDFMFVAVVLPVNMYTYLGHGWQFHALVCKFIGFLGYTLTGTTIMTITLIAWNRYKLVVDVSVYKSLFTPRNMVLMLAATWIIPALCLLPAAFGVWGHFGYVPMLSSCNLGLDSSSQSFKIFLLIVRAAIPCGIIIYYYSAIYATTRASHQRLHHLASCCTTAMRQQNHRREMRLTRMMIGIFVVFVLSYFPCTISSVIDWSRLLSKTFHMFCQTSIFLGSAINPLLYGFMNEQFRSAYYQILTCSVIFKGCRCTSSALREMTCVADTSSEKKTEGKSQAMSCTTYESSTSNKSQAKLHLSNETYTTIGRSNSSLGDQDTDAVSHSDTYSSNTSVTNECCPTSSPWLNARTDPLDIVPCSHRIEEIQQSSI